MGSKKLDTRVIVRIGFACHAGVALTSSIIVKNAGATVLEFLRQARAVCEGSYFIRQFVSDICQIQVKFKSHILFSRAKMDILQMVLRDEILAFKNELRTSDQIEDKRKINSFTTDFDNEYAQKLLQLY